MLAKRPRDNIEQILIVISFKWLLGRWWMGANLPLCRALERVFNMTIKCLSFRFYCIFLSLSCELLCPPSSFSFLPPTHPPSSSSSYLSLFTSLHLYSAAFAQIKLRLQFSPSQSTYLCFMTRTKSILCCYWFFSPLFLLPSCLNRHKPFCLLLSDSYRSFLAVNLSVWPRPRKPSMRGVCVCFEA